MKWDTGPGNILGLKASEDLKLNEFVNTLQNITEETDENSIVKAYENNVFDGVGRMKGVKITYDIDPTVPPKAQRHRPISFHMRQKVDLELQLYVNYCRTALNGIGRPNMIKRFQN